MIALLLALALPQDCYADEFERVSRVVLHKHTETKPVKAGKHTRRTLYVDVERRGMYFGKKTVERIKVKQLPLSECWGPYQRVVFTKDGRVYRLLTRTVLRVDTESFDPVPAEHGF